MGPTHNNQNGPGAPKRGGGSVKITTPALSTELIPHTSWLLGVI